MSNVFYNDFAQSFVLSILLCRLTKPNKRVQQFSIWFFFLFQFHQHLAMTKMFYNQPLEPFDNLPRRETAMWLFVPRLDMDFIKSLQP